MVSDLFFEVLLGLAPHYGQNSQLLSKNYEILIEILPKYEFMVNN